MKRKKMKQVLTLLLTAAVSMTVLMGCQKQTQDGSSVQESRTESQNDRGSEENGEGTKEAAHQDDIGTPQSPTKLRIEIFDRGAEYSAVDNSMTQWIKEEALKAGFDLEWVACPREQETEKLNVWMATGEAPDIVMTYDAALFTSYAKQGGIWALDEYIEQYGQTIEEKLGYLLPNVTYNGAIYALTGSAAPPASAPLKIRQDWLDVLKMDMPTDIDSLTEVLRAFKEQDPGNVGSKNVVPFAIPAPGVVGTPGGYLDLMLAFGVRDDAGYNNGFACLPSGNFDKETGIFRSPVDLEEAKAFYEWMNMLYKEELIYKEFAIDTTGDKYFEHVSSGVAGFVNCNAVNINNLTVDAVDTVDWEIVEPLTAPDGSKRVMLPKEAGMRMYIMIPRTCEKPGEAVRYFNWLIDNQINYVIANGFEGVHYNLTDGIAIPIADAAKDWNGTDTNLIGFVGLEPTPNDKLSITDPDERNVALTIQSREIVQNYGADIQINMSLYDRPVYEDKGSQLKQYTYEGAAKVIVAEDFEAAYQDYVDGWYALGGGEYDEEISAILVQEYTNRRLMP